MGCGGSKEAEPAKAPDAEAKAKADADAAAKAKAAADAAAKAKADADAAAAAAAAAAPPPTTPKGDGAAGGKGTARTSASGKSGAATASRPSSSSASKRAATTPVPTPSDHEANSSRDAPLVASRPNVDLNAAVDFELLKSKFKSFAEFGDGPAGEADAAAGAAVRIDAVRFAKLCRDSGLVDGKKLPLGGADVAFEGGLLAAGAKGLDISGRKLDYEGFLLALELVAKALGVPLTHVQLWICASSPLEKATQAQSPAASRPLQGPAEPVEPLKPVITANKLFKRAA